MNSGYNMPTPLPNPDRTGRPARASRTKRGYDRAHYFARQQVFTAQGFVCDWCKAAPCEHLHHIDQNTNNRARNNLVGVCAKCHNAHHASQ